MKKRSVAAALFAFLLIVFLSSENLIAQSSTGPHGFVCMTPMGPAAQMYGDSPFWAHAAFPPAVQYPIIVYSHIFNSLPYLMQVFTQHHECGHITLTTSNEFHANCYALQQLLNSGASANDIIFIRNFHYSVGPIGPQYGGSGAAFWQNTYNTCPQLAGLP